MGFNAVLVAKLIVACLLCVGIIAGLVLLLDWLG